jgi:hypothetical protein
MSELALLGRPRHSGAVMSPGWGDCLWDAMAPGIAPRGPTPGSAVRRDCSSKQTQRAAAHEDARPRGRRGVMVSDRYPDSMAPTWQTVNS